MDQDLEAIIKAFGKKVFTKIGKQQPSGLSKTALAGRLMQWSMKHTEFKYNLFRLIDVLPTLNNSQQIADHIHEYLHNPLSKFAKPLALASNFGRWPILSVITANITKLAIHDMASLFIAGKDAKSALARLKNIRRQNLAFTIDLLGEYALSENEALNYLERYQAALSELAKHVPNWAESKTLISGHVGDTSPVNVSIKLSALYSQCSVLNMRRSIDVLVSRLSQLVEQAIANNARLYVDAEDSATNPIIIETFKQVFSKNEYRTLPYPGIVVQAYAKNSELIVKDLLDFAHHNDHPIAIRLVKGAYWDQENIQARYNNWEPSLFELKAESDTQYEHLSRLLLDNHNLCLPAFGSHNIRSLAHACCYAESKQIDKSKFELQMLFGMAEPIARAFAEDAYLVRLYVPLGEMLPGMGYLVRRLLENTANESFLRHAFVDESEVDELLKRPDS